MSKTTAQEIIELGFAGEMFKKTNESEFSDFITGIISERSLILQGRIGTTVYDNAESPTKDYVKQAEKCLVAAELVQRRINIILGNAVGAGHEIDISHEGAQKKAYRDEAEDYIAKLTGGITSDVSDFASGVLVTSHFETGALSGEEQT
jgi:hypothetical protein